GPSVSRGGRAAVAYTFQRERNAVAARRKLGLRPPAAVSYATGRRAFRPDSSSYRRSSKQARYHAAARNRAGREGNAPAGRTRRQPDPSIGPVFTGCVPSGANP